MFDSIPNPGLKGLVKTRSSLSSHPIHTDHAPGYPIHKNHETDLPFILLKSMSRQAFIPVYRARILPFSIVNLPPDMQSYAGISCPQEQQKQNREYE